MGAPAVSKSKSQSKVRCRAHFFVVEVVRRPTPRGRASLAAGPPPLTPPPPGPGRTPPSRGACPMRSRRRMSAPPSSARTSTSYVARAPRRTPTPPRPAASAGADARMRRAATRPPKRPPTRARARAHCRPCGHPPRRDRPMPRAPVDLGLWCIARAAALSLSPARADALLAQVKGAGSSPQPCRPSTISIASSWNALR